MDKKKQQEKIIKEIEEIKERLEYEKRFHGIVGENYALNMFRLESAKFFISSLDFN